MERSMTVSEKLLKLENQISEILMSNERPKKRLFVPILKQIIKIRFEVLNQTIDDQIS